VNKNTLAFQKTTEKVTKAIPVPTYLCKSGRAFFEKIYGEFELEEHHIRILELAADCLDRIEKARKILRREGQFIHDRFHQIKEHPGAKALRDDKMVFAKLMRELGLDITISDSKPPGLY